MTSNEMATHGQVAQGATNLYDQYIIPCIQDAQQGNKICFVTPSTFFGFYSLGAHNFVRVCKELQEAQKRKVEIRLLICVHDAFSATAADGLCSFLDDGEEIKSLIGNTHDYFLFIDKGDKDSRFVEFVTGSRTPLSYLPGIEARPFAGDCEGIKTLSEAASKHKRSQFNRIWNSADSVNVKPEIAKYSVIQKVRDAYIRMQYLSYFCTFLVGFLLGALVLFQDSLNSANNQQQPMKVILVFFVGTITGVLAGAASQLMTHYFKKNFTG